MSGPDGFMPPSLDRLFEPPEGFAAEFGWVIGYSADASFLDSAVERFSGLTKAQRDHQGRVYLAVIIDPGHAQIAPSDCAGVLHLALEVGKRARPFKLLHAKLAMLLFRSPAGDPLVRLIVSTGNWTRQTIEQSLDLAWSVDLKPSDRIGPSDSIGRAESKEARADIASAWRFVTWLTDQFDDRALRIHTNSHADTETSIAHGRAVAQLNGVRAPRGVQPRFMDNRASSLLKQLNARIHDPHVKRNFIAMGSGFFEAPSPDGGVPAVLEKLVNELTSNGSLTTGRPTKQVVVNPAACQAVAQSWAALKRGGWIVTDAIQPKFMGGATRSLHAKFVFSANRNPGSDRCTKAWIYLGSANLTRAGFTNKMGASGGNLEAGVTFNPGVLFWAPRPKVPLTRVITNLLPIGRHDSESALQSTEVSAGDDMPELGDDLLAGPIPWLIWEEGGTESGWLSAPEGAAIEGVAVIDPARHHCPIQDGRWLWPGPQPREVVVSHESRCIVVPVLDHYGRLAGTRLRHLDIDEAWAQLADFPEPPDDEATAEYQADTLMPGLEPAEGTGSPRSSTYPIREAMQLVERIADKQVMIRQADWVLWCRRLEQILTQAAANPLVDVFTELGINPLSPLWCKPFRPTYAESADSEEGVRYEAALKNIEHAWGVAELPQLERIG